jgi:predicted ribosomally synthesized peptide with SipW-like signal peptide
MANDDDGSFRLSRRKALAGLGSIGMAGALGVGGTYAQFTDTEGQTATFSAGGIDGTITTNASYLGDLLDRSDDPANVEFTGEGPGATINFTDVKPGDYGSFNFTLVVQDNPAWVAACIGNVDDRDYKNFEPEVDADPQVNESDVNAGPQNVTGATAPEHVTTDGELANNMLVIPFYDSDTTSTFFDNNGIPESSDLQNYGVGTSDAFWDNNENDLKPLTVNQAASVQAKNSMNWSTGTPKEVSHPTAEVEKGCLLLDGSITRGDPSSDNSREANPLQPGDQLQFGFDWHLPYTTGNAAQGDQLTVNVGFNFYQERHSGGPDMVNMYNPETEAETEA